MKRLLLILICFFCMAFVSFSQDTITVKGRYYAKNVFVLNPSVDTAFAVKNVLVNEKDVKCELHSNSFEIDLNTLGLTTGEDVVIKVVYEKDSKVRVVNPEALQQESSFAFLSAKADKNGKITWVVKGDIYSSFSIEQNKWQKWLIVGDVDLSDSIKKNIYTFDVKPHFGQNTFRISHTDDKGNVVYSKPVKYKSPLTMKEVFLASSRVTEAITFTGDTSYEIWDDKGNFIKDGYGSSVVISELPKGKYFVNYDYKTETVTKK